MIGRENTMFIAFGMEGVGIWRLYVRQTRSGS
jgi:OFA family oxalate/formate antiporter-like MFS transporter